MVKDRNELLQVARQNANQLKAHLRQAILMFMNMQRVNADELAYVLGITGEEMAQILDGDGNVTVDVLSKLLVATDNVVEIKPISATPMRGFGPGMPASGGFPGIPTDENGRPVPPPGFPQMPGGFRRPQRPMGNRNREVAMETADKQPRDANGRFAPRNAGAHRTATRRNATRTAAPAVEVNPYANVPDDALTNIIRQNLWDGEIDLAHATHEDLARFVFDKENLLRQRTEGGQRQAEQPVAEQPAATQAPVGGSGAVNQFLNMLHNMAQEVQNNPQLAETIARFIPQQG